jgi:hypothetical protein
VKISGKDWTALQIQDSLDAPAGVFAFEAELAIADFYNHRIMYNNGEKWTQIGSEGKGAGQFYYPTDVHIDDSHIWVADAYNNRVQKFDKSGQFVQTIASDQKINAATGLFVSTTQLFVTDFEHSRVLVFDMFGNLQGTLSDGIEKPTDILQVADTLYICNYRNASLTLYVQKPGASETK